MLWLMTSGAWRGGMRGLRPGLRELKLDMTGWVLLGVRVEDRGLEALGHGGAGAGVPVGGGHRGERGEEGLGGAQAALEQLAVRGGGRLDLAEVGEQCHLVITEDLAPRVGGVLDDLAQARLGIE